MPIKPRDVGDKDGIDLYRSVMKSKTTREMERENLPKEAVYRDVPPFGKFPYDVIRRGTCVVHQLPIHHFPSNVRVSSGDPEEIFAGFVYEDSRTQNRDYKNVQVGGGDFTVYTMGYDPRCPFELKGKVYAGPKGLLVDEPCAFVGIVVSLPTVEDPFLGVMGQTLG
jgi:hypothetical protein